MMVPLRFNKVYKNRTSDWLWWPRLNYLAFLFLCDNAANTCRLQLLLHFDWILITRFNQHKLNAQAFILSVRTLVTLSLVYLLMSYLRMMLNNDFAWKYFNLKWVNLRRRISPSKIKTHIYSSVNTKQQPNFSTAYLKSFLKFPPFKIL